MKNRKYVLILKFSEVYFNGEKILDINLGEENIIKLLDIFSKLGKSTAYDEYVEFEFKDGKVYLQVNKIFLFFKTK